MTPSDLKQTLSSYSSRDLEQRKHWYSPAAAAYNQVRPRYPQSLIQQVVAIAQLPTQAKILEVGCGPATATVAFAELGYSMLCIEPNPDFYQFAQHNCQAYPNVEFQHTSFEEWPLVPASFDAVLAASSFHWIPPEVGYPKAARALKANGCLILLWNTELRPSLEVHRILARVYQEQAPWLIRDQDEATQQQVLQDLGQMAIASGPFQDLVTGQVTTTVTYNTADYLALLQTYSPYLELDPQRREALFTALHHTLNQELGGKLQLSYLSAFHVVRKLS